MNKKIIMICLIGLLLISPVSAKMVTAKVDDKGLIWVGGEGIVGTLHTEYGTITVTEEDYNKVMINDTITYDTDMHSFWNQFWSIKVEK